MTKNKTAARPVKALLGVKVGMTQVWDENAKLVPVTVVKVGKNVVTQIRTEENDGYSAVQIASGELKNKNVTKPLAGHFEKAGVTPRRFVAEIRTSDADSYELGQELGVDTFEVGQLVDVVGKSKGKGFAGTMKRHGFAGISASHGAHRNHRKPGSIGGASTPGRVFRGQRMAGRMGNARVTVQNLTIHAIDTENDVLLVSGAIPGNKGGAVVIRTAVKGA
ncbi:50S ribosomal protein L3 [Trueperella bialowiezensis]|uniref:Large ribosomal subunit protein uL3 n=1 Tax=Trueperella bialowiezensis TaxID=312285 RepID=A0A448PD38_9ACTO|nr:50S ribosomal protein L3 [Trueperella bialowiezensis]VEI12850.1 50S ribosomal protein L3 [Trueperella bialowiezensis]